MQTQMQMQMQKYTAFTQLQSNLVKELGEGITELEVAARFEYEFKMAGASGPSFAPIVLFGSRSSLPHGVPTQRALQRGDIVLLDFGCVRESYCSDLTRTYVFDTIPAAWFEEIYAVTLKAQLAGLAAIRPGASCRDVDASAREIRSEERRVGKECRSRWSPYH